MFMCWVALQLWWRCNYSEYGTCAREKDAVVMFSRGAQCESVVVASTQGSS